MPVVKNFKNFVNESKGKYPHEIKNEKYWRDIAYGDSYLNKVLDSIMQNQKGFASDRQMTLLKRKASGDSTPYSTKN